MMDAAPPPLNFPFEDQLPDGEDPADELADGDLVEAALDYEAQQRFWLKAIIPLLQLRSHDTDPSGRVQLAFDLMHIAACERVARLLRSDLLSDRG
jgi:hypothetical protein